MKPPFFKLCAAALAAGLLALPGPTLAADTARASANLRIYDGPSEDYAVIGTLRKGARVELARCNRRGTWCLFRDNDGEPVGWVRASYLIGIGAITKATPFRFLSNPELVQIPAP